MNRENIDGQFGCIYNLKCVCPVEYQNGHYYYCLIFVMVTPQSYKEVYMAKIKKNNADGCCTFSLGLFIVGVI